MCLSIAIDLTNMASIIQSSITVKLFGEGCSTLQKKSPPGKYNLLSNFLSLNKIYITALLKDIMTHREILKTLQIFRPYLPPFTSMNIFCSNSWLSLGLKISLKNAPTQKVNSIIYCNVVSCTCLCICPLKSRKIFSIDKQLS